MENEEINNQPNEEMQEQPANNEQINLGDSIQLSGFKQVDRSNMIIVKKIVGSQVRKLQDMVEGFERLKIHLKPIHKTEQNMNHELHAELIYSGKLMNSQTTNRNIFMGLSDIFNSLENQIKK
jgi:hypothetical protein